MHPVWLLITPVAAGASVQTEFDETRAVVALAAAAALFFVLIVHLHFQKR